MVVAYKYIQAKIAPPAIGDGEQRKGSKPNKTKKHTMKTQNEKTYFLAIKKTDGSLAPFLNDHDDKILTMPCSEAIKLALDLERDDRELAKLGIGNLEIRNIYSLEYTAENVESLLNL